jgi:hypothetical protein
MAGDHQEVVRPRRDGFPFAGSDFDLTVTVDACAFAQEWDVRLESDLFCRVPQGGVSASECLLVFLSACVPVHAREIPVRSRGKTFLRGARETDRERENPPSRLHSDGSASTSLRLTPRRGVMFGSRGDTLGAGGSPALPVPWRKRIPVVSQRPACSGPPPHTHELSRPG